jgi:hypothetical protein
LFRFFAFDVFRICLFIGDNGVLTLCAQIKELRVGCVRIKSRVARFFSVQHTKTGKKTGTAKYTKWPSKYQHFPLQDVPKIYPNLDFLLENISSGNTKFKISKRKQNILAQYIVRKW